MSAINVQRHPSPPPRVYKRVPPGHQKHRHDDRGECHHPRGKHKNMGITSTEGIK
ncbi:MAG: hypothetical protein IPJ74_25745 [Saprospiraceae bacterium]|nr:hypothetical protein [Saprospiraceae bacterium]